MTPDQIFLAQHSAHDFDAVTARWEKIAIAANLEKIVLAENEGGWPVFAYETRGQKPRGDAGLYLCAGVHGDEPAGVWGLLEWAEENVAALRDEIGALIFPCFNPSGLAENRRTDHAGRDLNRLFHDESIPLMQAWQQLIAGRDFRLALHFHEDYDARGVYLYELTRSTDEPGGQGLLDAVQSIIPREIRDEIDGSEFERAVLVGDETDMPARVEAELDGGYPEAIFLFLNHARQAMTFETPSEFSLWDRVQAHRRFIESATSRFR